jgi:hypothetical protein
MDTRIPQHLQDPMTMERINVRCRTAAPRSTMFLRFDAARIEWLASELEDADRPEHARLARRWVEELRSAADRIEAQDAEGNAA